MRRRSVSKPAPELQGSATMRRSRMPTSRRTRPRPQPVHRTRRLGRGSGTTIACLSRNLRTVGKGWIADALGHKAAGKISLSPVTACHNSLRRSHLQGVREDRSGCTSNLPKPTSSFLSPLVPFACRVRKLGYASDSADVPRSPSGVFRPKYLDGGRPTVWLPLDLEQHGVVWTRCQSGQRSEVR